MHVHHGNLDFISVLGGMVERILHCTLGTLRARKERGRGREQVVRLRLIVERTNVLIS